MYVMDKINYEIKIERMMDVGKIETWKNRIGWLNVNQKITNVDNEFASIFF